MTSVSSILERPAAVRSVDAADLSGHDLFARLLDAAAQLRVVVAQRARQTELDRRVSADITQQLKDAGLYRVVQPRRFGGYELGLEALRSLAFEIGRG
ncbi:alkylation response protein AidB-like acyl-CoA dehydrogenase [Paraburkholderia sp. GAS199]|uniref:hypothetical protein n=1 Tax=Paraburkholderia sp. GAS199 TaxID=3035126 RepID=UPI003D2203C1